MPLNVAFRGAIQSLNFKWTSHLYLGPIYKAKKCNIVTAHCKKIFFSRLGVSLKWNFFLKIGFHILNFDFRQTFQFVKILTLDRFPSCVTPYITEHSHCLCEKNNDEGYSR